ncbi:sugar ABC transporter substrate-binding protein [Salisediminibacterium beveridgei]|uniref:Maltodextrin-binding protein n=1 Tax=Salisediminibacterium beveridgei TaxID=632773 RepID=A0A1D7QWP5_9BACI|nr:extracellular solute-binding protein [Salisediminibacterium beveridgei]AOM83411.1 sugar ABC transporter periplasmic substrate-binding protein [Salisediminibacterium beveridgei]AOM83426.1 sugar ABC transporter periplasmic substrate-binding protein [Salisediminibacterium beveridgei]
MFKSKPFLRSLTVVSALSVGLVACGNNDDNANNETPANDPGNNNNETNEANNNEGNETAEADEPEKPDELTIWVNDEDAQLDAHEDMAEAFESEYGIAVNITPYSMLEQTEGMSLDGPAGQGPDLFFQPHDRMGDIYDQGLALDLDLTEDQESRLAEYNQEAVTSFSYEGEQFGIPAVVETYALFRNTDLVPDAPETMDELMDVARDLTDGETYGFLMEATNFYFSYPFLTAPGGYVFGQDDDGVYDPDDIGLASEGAVEGAEIIQSWFEEDLMPTGIDGDIMNGLFTDGQAGMVVTGPWSIPDYEEALGDSLEISPLPEMNGERLSSFSGNKGWLVNYYSENPYWATELALFLTNAENSEMYFEVAGELPAHTAVEIDDEFMAPIFEQTQYSEPMPNIPAMSQVWEPIGDALQFVSDGDDAEDVLQEAVDQIHEQVQMMQ